MGYSKGYFGYTPGYFGIPPGSVLMRSMEPTTGGFGATSGQARLSETVPDCPFLSDFTPRDSFGPDRLLLSLVRSQQLASYEDSPCPFHVVHPGQQRDNRGQQQPLESRLLPARNANVVVELG